MRKRIQDDVVVLPEAGDALPVVHLRTMHNSGHPWIFRRMAGEPDNEIEPGTLVEVIDKARQFVGRGFYNPNSEIAVRLLTTTQGAYPDRNWFHATIANAVKLRHDVLKLNETCNAYRLVHSEGDGLSGLIADRYGDCIVLQLFSAGIHRHIDWIRDGFSAQFPNCEIIVKSDFRTEKLEGVKMDGPPPRTREVVIHEHNLKLNVDLRRGHKTGYFLDQRDNRRRMAEFCKGHKVFDGFCYTGGFALSAALNGAASVEAVDLDEKVIEVAEENKKLNGLGENLKFVHGNVFDVLRDRRAAGERYSRMILDPAKLAISRHDINKALSGYADMNRLGMQCLEPGGVLLSCSCTGLISEEQFLMALRAAAEEANVELQILAIHGAPGDHPWAVRAPEGRYLKAVFSRVMPLV